MRPVLRLALMAGVLVGVVPSRAEDNPRAGAAAEKAIAPENLSQSAVLASDRTIQNRLAAARVHLQQGRFAAAIDALQQVLNADNDSFVADGTRYASVKSEANRLIATLPAEGLQIYENHAGAAAQVILDASLRVGDAQKLIDVSVRYRSTKAGFQALQLLAARAFDRGRFVSAAAGFQAVMHHPLCDGPTRDACLVQRIVSLIRGGETMRAEQLIADSRDHLAKRQIRVAGHPVLANEWLNGLLPHSAPNAIQTQEQPSVGLDGTFFLEPTWQFETSPLNELSTILDEALAETKRHGVALLDTNTPLVAHGTVVYRTLEELIARDLKSGAVKWRTPLGPKTGQVTDGVRLANNETFRGIVSDALVARIQSDSVAGRLTTDGSRVFAVSPIDDGTEPSGSQALVRNLPLEGNAQQSESPNRLAAYDLENGSVLWEAGAEGVDFGPAADFLREVFFLGPPLVRDGELYAIGQHQREVRLIVLNAQDGRLLWWLALADLSGTADDDIRRGTVACQAVYDGGVLICSTAAGAVVAVDLLTRSFQCAYRFERDDIPPAAGPPQGRLNREGPPQWWRGWRMPVVVASGGRVIVASPESNAVHALDLSSGRRLWKQSREDGLFVAGADGRQVVVVRRYHVESLNVETGETRWTTHVGPPAGQGVFTGSDFILPLADRRLMTIRLDDGESRSSDIASELALGNLTPCDGGVISQIHDRLAFFPSLEPARLELSRRLEAENGDPLALRSLARLELQSGEFDAAASRLATLLAMQEDAETRRQLRETLLSDMRRHPEQVERIAPAIEPLLETSADRIEFLQSSAWAHRQNGHFVEALRSYFRLLELNPAGEAVAGTGPQRLVRFDRRIQGEIADMLDAAGSPERLQLEAAFEERLSQALASNDPFAPQRFSQQFGQLTWGRHVRTALAAKAGLGVQFLASQLSLLELAEQPDRKMAAAATFELASIMRSNNYRSDAAALYQRLRDEFADVAVDGNRLPQHVIAELADDPELTADIEHRAKDPWPLAPPEVSIRNENNPRAGYVQVPVEAARGSLYDRLGVSIDRLGTSLRFHGAGQHGFWELELPASESALRGIHPLHRGWGVGHLLVLRVGSDLFGVSALDETGEPRARILWQLETRAGGTPTWNQLGRIDVARAPRGFGPDRIRIIDRYDRELAQVGPVRPGYICYHDKASLIAVETATAARLWERFDIPPGTITSGDDEHVLLYRRGSPDIEILRAIDGKTVRTRRLDLTPDRFLAEDGRHALVESRLPGAVGLRIAKIDLIDGDNEGSLWHRDFAANSIPFAIDREWLGVLDGAGLVHLVRLRNGAPVATHPLAPPNQDTEVSCVVDEARIYVLCSGRFKDENNLEVNRERRGFRTVLASGILCGFDRHDGRLLWQTGIDDALMSLDQPREGPLLVFSYWRNQAGDDGSLDPLGVIRCLDKRTGKPVYENFALDPRGVAYYVVEPFVEQAALDLKTPSLTIRFQYAKP